MGFLGKNCLLVSLLAMSLAACVSGTALVTGTKRTPLDPGQVKLYREAPAKYEVIGIVSASSSPDWTAQGTQDFAVKELKNQAAKLGANGVLLESPEVFSFGMAKVSGTAVFVSVR